MNHVVIAGGIYHDFESTSAELANRAAAVGLRTRVFLDPEEALRSLAATSACRLLTVNALRFTMDQNEKYEPYRLKWAFTLSDRGRRTIAEFVRAGGALLGLHTASLCFDGWTEWGVILGARWRWGTSFHPPAGAVRVEAVDVDEPLTAGAAPFDVHDEVYHRLDLQPAARALLRARSATHKAFQPVMWAHHYGRGRVIYDSLGHGVDSLNEPTHRAILERAMSWLLGQTETVDA